MTKTGEADEIKRSVFKTSIMLMYIIYFKFIFERKLLQRLALKII